MNKRIRYTKTSEENVVESLRVLRNDEEEFRVKLHTVGMRFEIKNLTTGEEITGGRTTNLTILKRQVKSLLIKMGVQFEEENRAPKRTNI